MESVDAIGGAWTGRLIDVLGSEGRFELKLEGRDKRGRLRGQARVSLTNEDEAISLTADVAGKLDDDRLTLELTGVKGAKIRLVGQVFTLPRGGAGLRGTYEVTAEAYSPLRAGVIAASRDRRGGEEMAVPTRRSRDDEAAST